MKISSVSIKRKFAFTLAEVLITLSIIGIVASMTMPALIGHYKKQEVASKLKKFSSTMQSAFNMAIAENGDFSTWNYPSKQNDKDQINEFINTYIYPYLTGIKKCDAGNRGCPQIRYTKYDFSSTYVFSDGSCFNILTGGSDNAGAMLHITYDYNCSKAPNEYDKDIFAFVIKINKNSSFCKFKAGSTATWAVNDRDELLRLCENHLSSPHTKGGCSALIEYDNWEIKKDYPWIK